MYDVILIRYGEIGLKGGNRKFFENILMNNLRQALSSLPEVQVFTSSGRILVRAVGQLAEATRCINQVFGVVSTSPVMVVKPEWSAIEAAADQLIDASGIIHTFKVEARRADKSFPLNSPEINRTLGEYLLQSHPGLKVDVHSPDLKLEVEVRYREVLLYGSICPGPGGLPVSSSGRGLLLLSGGLDSPVAGWMAMKRGIKLSAVYFHSFPYTGDRSKEKVVSLAHHLAPYNQGEIKLYVAHITEIQEAITHHCPEKFRVTILRRMMLRIAQMIATREKALALITGESVGQVASQTLESMNVIGAATKALILKPVCGMDKTEIVEIARKIDTYDTSILPYEDCCALFVPQHPVTRPVLEEVQAAEEEANVDWTELLQQSMNRLEIIRVKAKE
ncbi:MAG: tRNA uracil 4-sulfurtransferase ThiI [Methylocystaceae bacterium]